MFDYWLGLAGVGCLLWVFRIPITFQVYMKGKDVCEWFGWDACEIFFAKEAIACFYYHPEWFPKDLMDEEEKEEWRKMFEDVNPK